MIYGLHVQPLCLLVLINLRFGCACVEMFAFALIDLVFCCRLLVACGVTGDGLLLVFNDY